MLKILLGCLFVCVSLQAEMSLEDKVGQLFFGFIYGEELDDATKGLLQRTRLGNIIYYRWANGLDSTEQVRRLSSQLREAIQEVVGFPPLIAADQEGGRVCRLSGGWPSAADIGTTGDPSYAYAVGAAIAEQLGAAGVCLNLAPVVDVQDNPQNPVIGDRSFGDHPDLVIAMAAQFIAAHRAHHVATALKHFPGHGNVYVDSHLGLPVVSKTLAELEAVEFAPFRQLANQANAIMTGHLLVPALDPDHPATTSYTILTNLLRHSWGYDGLILSDSLVMRAIAPDQSTFENACEAVSRAAISAFQAGCDAFILGRLEWADFSPTAEQNLHLIEHVLNQFRQAILSGEISLGRLDASVQRILRLKGDFSL